MKSMTSGFISMVLLILATPHLTAQGNMSFDEEMKKGIIQSTITLLQEQYIFPERVNAIEVALLEKLNRGGYFDLTEPGDFLGELNRDLEQESGDYHLNITFNPERVAQIRLDKQNEAGRTPIMFTEPMMQRMRYENFRMRKVERLEGNVGYFQFLNFLPLAAANESMVSAMNFLRHSGALILDLRENGGGDAESMNFLLGYFLPDATPTGVWRHRIDNRIENVFIKADPDVKKIPDDVQVYVLVGPGTSSAAEGFAYTLQQYRRATIVGEQTKGEGNPGQLFVINDFLYIMIPTIEGLNPVTGKSIDGTGVTPDIAVSSSASLSRALLEIYTHWSTSSTNPAQKQLAQWMIPALKYELQPEPLPLAAAMSLTGEYEGGRRITYENGAIFYHNATGRKFRLDFMGDGVFQHAESKWLRLKMPPDTSMVQTVTWYWDDGGTETMEKK